MAEVVFQCDVNRGFLRKIDGNEKSLYLEISDDMITGKYDMMRLVVQA